MNLFIFQTENYKKIITIALMISIAMSLVPLRRAQAIPVKDIIHIIMTTLQSFWDRYLSKVWDEIQPMLLEMIKQAVLGVMINQTLNWVGGGGKPQFITNWKGFVRGAANKVKDQTLAQIKKFANTCLAFKVNLNALLDARYQMNPIQGLKCPNPILNNPAFFNDFEVGSWPGYMDSFLPSGNFYGATNVGVGIVEGETAAAANAAENEGLGGKGFASAKKCTQTAEGQNCDTIKTPGATVESIAGKAVTSPGDLPPNAGHKVIASLTAIFFMGLLQKLIVKGLGP